MKVRQGDPETNECPDEVDNESRAIKLSASDRVERPPERRSGRDDSMSRVGRAVRTSWGIVEAARRMPDLPMLGAVRHASSDYTTHTVGVVRGGLLPPDSGMAWPKDALEVGGPGEHRAVIRHGCSPGRP